MVSEKSTNAISNFFSSLFNNFPRLILTNLIFAIPFALFLGIFWLINSLTGINSFFILLLTAIPLFPFYAGVTQVTSHMARGEEKVSVLYNFINGVKDNFLRFLIHGVIFYLAVFFSYYSITFYINMGTKNGIFYFFLALCIMVSVFFLFMFFYISPMTVTFDISMKNIYKNSALMTFGEIKHNLLAVFALLILFIICSTILFCCVGPMAITIATIALVVLLIPSLTSFLINSIVYNPMYYMIVDNDKKSTNINKKIEDKRNGKNINNNETENNIFDDFSDIDIDENKDGDEYIFYKGKMIKRSLLIKLKKEVQIGESEKNGR